MLDSFSRTELLLGSLAMDKLQNAHVAIFGIGGVGGYSVEALARSGIGYFDLIDDDKVCLTNINRQIIATRKTIGQYKTEIMKQRILEINPDAKVHVHQCFFLPDTKDLFDFGNYTYVIDAVDTVTAKIQLVIQAQVAKVPIISCMGAGNKLDPTRFEVADIYETSVCPLAKVMRKELRKRGVEHLKVVYSKETPIEPRGDMPTSNIEGCACPPSGELKSVNRRAIPGSVSFVPAVAGLIMAGEVIKEIIGRT